MADLMKSRFLWQFAGGFVLGTVGLFALQPAAADTVLHHIVPTHVAAR